MVNEIRSHCPINYLLETVGDKWSLLVVRDLMFYNKRSYGEFLGAEEKIATNILADRLARLETAGIIVREVAVGGSRATYRLTRKGMDLLPMLLEMILWSAKHDAETAAPAAFIKRIKKDRAALLAEIEAAWLKGIPQ